MIYTIELACDTTEADQFKEWLISRGHDVQIGNSTGNYIDGECTSHSIVANDIMRNLWEDYCNDK